MISLKPIYQNTPHSGAIFKCSGLGNFSELRVFRFRALSGFFQKSEKYIYYHIMEYELIIINSYLGRNRNFRRFRRFGGFPKTSRFRVLTSSYLVFFRFLMILNIVNSCEAGFS